MKYIQSREPNVHKPCTPGYCLTYAQDVFGVPAKQPSALADWNANTYNHADRNFPAGMAVPIWFSGRSGDLETYGHVAVRLADGSVWSCSHPTSHEPMRFNSIEALNNYYSGQLIYLGWTEDVEDVRVIEQTKGEESMRVMTHDEIYWNFRLILGLVPSEKQISEYKDKPYDYVNEDMKKFAADRGLDYFTFRKNTGKQIAELTNTLASPADTSEAEKVVIQVQAALEAVEKFKGSKEK